MKLRNPLDNTQRSTEANRARTVKRVERYYGKLALLQTWERMPTAVQCRNHGYMMRLTKCVRVERNYLEHRAGPDSDL